MLYCSWDTVCDRCNYFSFWAIFSPFIPLTARKIKIKKKRKKRLEISSVYTSVPNIISYTVPEIWRMTDVIVIFHFGLFFALLPSLFREKINACAAVHTHYVMGACNHVQSIILLPPMMRVSFLLVPLTMLIFKEPKHWVTWSHRMGMNFPFLREKRIQCFSVSA